MIKLKHILLGLGLILFDIIVYLFLGLLLMQYDDFYNESKGEYWGLASMTSTEKIYYIGFNVWNILNLIAMGYIVLRAIKWIKIRNAGKGIISMEGNSKN
jgi:hypothetical protein